MAIFWFRQNAMNLHYIYTFFTKNGLNSNKVEKGHNLPLTFAPGGGICYHPLAFFFLRITKKNASRSAAPLDSFLHINFGQCVTFLTPGHFRSVHQVKVNWLYLKKTLQSCPACSVCLRGFNLGGLYDGTGTSNMHIPDFPYVT